MPIVTRRVNGKLVREEIVSQSYLPPPRRQPEKVDPKIVSGIINYLKLAESNRERYRDVLDEFMKSQSAATMKAVAAQKMQCSKPKTKAEAKRLLVKAFNMSTLEKQFL